MIGAFLFEWRVALVSVLAIPLSLVAAGLTLYYFNATMNTMILAGLVIALGAVVDDAIVDVENIMRRLHESRARQDGASVARIILEASVEIRSAIVYASLIIVLAVLPVFFLTGLAGAFFKPLVLAYVLAMFASLVVAVTVTPALCLILLQNADLGEKPSPLVGFLHRWYDKALQGVVRRPAIAFVLVGASAVAGIGLYPFLGQELLPSFKERDFLMHWVTEPSTSHAEMNRITIAASKELQAIPGVRNFGAHIGQAYLMDEVVGVNFGENWISLDPSVPTNKPLLRCRRWSMATMASTATCSPI